MRVITGWGAVALASALVVGGESAAQESESGSPSASLALAEGQVLLPWTQPGGDATDLSMALSVPMDGRYRFHLEAEGGQASLRVTPGLENELVGTGSSEWLSLARGEVQLRARFQGSAQGSARRFRVLWEMEPSAQGGFPPEPIAAGRPLAVDGRAQLTRKGCTNCHETSEKEAFAVERRPGPSLIGVTERLSPDWLGRWISNPSALKPEAHMPRVFVDSDVDSARAVVHYLASLSPATDTEPATEAASAATEPAVLDQGRRLFHGLGCVACHGALDAPSEVFGDEFLSQAVPAAEVPAPFGDVRKKWRPGALAEFLRDPRTVYPDGRMPSLNLSESEADLLATYLVSKWGSAEDELAYDEDQARWGREIFFKFDCGACHEIPGVPRTERPPPLADLRVPAANAGPGVGRGCLDPSDLATPRYEGLDVGALAAGILQARKATGFAAPLDHASRTLDRLSCLACHAMHGQGGVPEELQVYFTTEDEHVDLGDEGRLPPVLSDVGWRLQTRWLGEILSGEGRSRPYMTARMPSYGAEHVGELPEELARLAGVLPHSDVEEPVSTDELVLAGRGMMGRTSLGCVACHVYKDYPANGSPGLAITQFGERLRYEWYRSFMLNPQRYRPGSRMPDFGTGGKSTLTDVFDGDMQRQADAMWAYFNLGEFMPPPDGVEPEGGNVILVEDRPVVLRAFLPGAGARGIAVGTKVGVHYGFSAEECRLTDVWQGDFLDASGAWAGRRGSTLGGLGGVVWQAPEGVPFSFTLRPEVLPESSREQAGLNFRGYRLAKDGTPTFLHRVGPYIDWDAVHSAVGVEETIAVEATPRLRILRTLRFSGEGPPTPRTMPDLWINTGPGDVRVRSRVGDGAWEDAEVLRTDGHAFHKRSNWDPSTGSLTVEMEIFP